MHFPFSAPQDGVDTGPAFQLHHDEAGPAVSCGRVRDDEGADADGGRDRRSTGRRTLVVDDDRSAAHSLAFALGSYGESLDVALSVPEARRLLNERTFDLVLTDFDMPAGGRRWLAELRAKHPRVKVVVVTGHAEDPGLSGTYGLADTVLHKPTDPEVVLAVITRLLGER